MTARIIRKRLALRQVVASWKGRGETVGVVPTMGALHEGHLSLVRKARAQCDRVIVTLFVNPMQFNDKKDLVAYPRTEAGDLALLGQVGIDVLYAPLPDQIYPDGFSTTVSVSGVSAGLCGDFRPGHFAGVATVVAKLLLQTAADKAYFGEKDYQQLQVVRQMSADLDIPVRIIACPTVREADGLAMSSRNRRLDPVARKSAALLSRLLFAGASEISDGATPKSVIAAAIRKLRKAGFGPVEYFELRSARNLAPLPALTEPGRLLAAAHLGGVRLIDNVAVPMSSRGERGKR